MQKIKPCLWFDGKAEEAAKFYVSIFKNSKILSVNPVVTVFEIDGAEIIGLNGGPKFKFTEAVSLSVDCETQAEIDELWDRLSGDGGATSQCGWLKDKYGLSWQIVPKALPKLMNNPDPKKAERVMKALMKMTKLDIAELQRAADAT